MLKNLISYKLAAPFDMSAGKLEALLRQKELQPCPGGESMSRGFEALTSAGEFVLNSERSMLMCYGQEVRKVPQAAVKREVERRARKLAEREGRPATSKERQALKSKVVEELLPKVLPKYSSARMLIDTTDQMIHIDSGGETLAEAAVKMLRDVLESFPVVRIDYGDLRQRMTQWLEVEEAPQNFNIGSACELVPPEEEGSKVVYTKHLLNGADVRELIGQGRRVMKLGMVHEGRVEFVLTTKGHLKRLGFADIEITASKEVEGGDDGAAGDDSDLFGTLAIVAGLIKPLLADLMQAGGAAITSEEVGIEKPKKVRNPKAGSAAADTEVESSGAASAIAF